LPALAFFAPNNGPGSSFPRIGERSVIICQISRCRPEKDGSSQIDLTKLVCQSGMQAVTVISTSRSGEFNITSTVVLAGLLVGKNLAYSSL
jgi:hypothetical protein